MNLSKRLRNFWVLFTLFMALALGGITTYAYAAPQHERSEYASAEIVGDPDGATDKVEYVDLSSSSIKRVVFFAAGQQTPVGINTPVDSGMKCGFGGRTLFSSSAYVVGTFTGTSPTIDVKWYHSIDGGTTWVAVGTWTQLTNTSITTPANTTQNQTVSDVWNSATSVAYGDCWKATKTYGGSGSVGGNVEVVMIGK